MKSEQDRYSDVLIYILLNKKGSSQYPDDVEFKHALLTRNVYSMNSKNKMYLFNRFENRDSKERVEVIKAMADGVYSVEHIIPQTLTEQWKRDLGPEHDRIYDDWLNTLANLTLTGYNSKYKNRPFIEKRDIKDGFKDSNLRLNSYVYIPEHSDPPFRSKVTPHSGHSDPPSFLSCAHFISIFSELLTSSTENNCTLAY